MTTHPEQDAIRELFLHYGLSYSRAKSFRGWVAQSEVDIANKTLRTLVEHAQHLSTLSFYSPQAYHMVRGR